MPKDHKEGMILWRPEAHEYFGESLFYFLVTFRAYRELTFDDFRRFLENHVGRDQCCVYAVLGAYDCLVRVWLNQVAYARLMAGFRGSELIRVVSEFAVSEQKHWAFRRVELPDAQVGQELSDYDPEDLHSVQQGNKPELARRLQERGLLVVQTDTWRSDRLKFYIALSEPEPGLSSLRPKMEKEITEVMESYVDRELLRSMSVYKGRGLAWMLVKGMVSQVETLTELAVGLRAAVSPYYLHTTTFILGARQTPESDNINADSLRGDCIINRLIYNWVPEFYAPSTTSVDFDLERRRAVEFYLLEQGLFRVLGLRRENRDFLAKLATGLAKREVSTLTGSFAASEILSAFFRNLESSLREDEESVLIAMSGGDRKRQASIAEQAGIPKSAKFEPLGEVLNHLERLLKRDKEPESKEAIFSREDGRVINEATYLRNLVQHNDTKYVQEWKPTLETMSRFLVILERLQVLVQDIVGAWNERKDVADTRSDK